MLWLNSPFNEEQNNLNWEPVANVVAELWLFSAGMCDVRVLPVPGSAIRLLSTMQRIAYSY